MTSDYGMREFEDQGDACAVQGPARVGQVPSDEHARAQRAKREPESTENPPTMRAKVDAAPLSSGSADTAPGTDCDHFEPIYRESFWRFVFPDSSTLTEVRCSPPQRPRVKRWRT